MFNGNNHLDKTIKLWKIKERRVQAVVENNMSLHNRAGHADTRPLLSLPKTVPKDPVVAAVPRRIYNHAHAYHIHSVSVCSDGETFLSSDDLRVNLWHLDDPATSFNIVDLKPTSIEDLTEVITACSFHPTHCHQFAYATSKGAVKLGDMRESALCDRYSKCFKTAASDDQQRAGSGSSFFAEIIQSISDAKFSPCGRYIAARDYLTVKIWDVAMETRPVATLPVHDHIRPRLCDLYENDCIFDKFRVSWSPDAKQVLTGSYGNHVRACDIAGGGAEEIVADKSVFRQQQHSSSLSALHNVGGALKMRPGSSSQQQQHQAKKLVGRRIQSASMDAVDAGSLDYSKKILSLAVHPTEGTMAVAATSNLFVFTQL